MKSSLALFSSSSLLSISRMTEREGEHDEENSTGGSMFLPSAMKEQDMEPNDGSRKRDW